jgi:sugar phosphate isomerase/epimerase
MIEIASKAGYDAIEPWVEEIDAWTNSGRTLSQLRSLVSAHDLTIVNLIGFPTWSVPDEQKRKAGFEEARRCFDMAQELACPYVAAPPIGIHQTPGVSLFDVADRYAALIDLASEYNVVPILEFWGIAQTMGTLGEALMVSSQANRRQACILSDIFHMYKGSGHFGGIEQLGPETIRILHVNDYPAQPPRKKIEDSDRVYPGDGVAPYNEIFRQLNIIGFSGILSLELFNQKYWQEDGLTVATTGLEKLKSLV